jgi:dTDP-4-amino-4,6-dideoxygalactose transaminase
LGGPPSVLVVDLGRPAEPVVSALAGCGIETRRWYCPPLHEHPAFAPFATGQAPEVSSRLGTSLLGLPFHHFLSSEDIGAVVAALAEALQSRPVPRPSADVGEAANTGWLPSASA